jgi:nucleoid-associated protein YgaU
MCFRIYGDSKYYLDVAAANGLDDFRSLTPGAEIRFPPIDKTAKSS